ncbi:hypothetical protein ACIGO9_31810 [Nocardia asteroides]|uniref:hypothetical protein n=1 Tax=Nocardia asteroides TaxID=1824 RepID=UPI0037CB843B
MTQLTNAQRASRLRDREPDIRAAMARWRELRATGGLRDPLTEIRLRNTFVENAAPTGSGSTRRLPARADRPPAPRLVTAQGSLLRWEIGVLAEAQLRTPIGRVPTNPRPLMGDDGAIPGWSDLFPLEAKPTSGTRATYSSVYDLRRNQLVGNVRKLVDDKFLRLPDRDPPPRRFDAEGFRLLEEGGAISGYEGEEYVVPKPDQDSFTVPFGLVENGWLFTLPESALVMLLFAARHYDPDSEDGVVMSEEDRIRRFGISPSTYGQAQLLDALGLLEVTMDPSRAVLTNATPRDKRHSRPNSLRMVPDRLADDGIEAMIAHFEN